MNSEESVVTVISNDGSFSSEGKCSNWNTLFHTHTNTHTHTHTHTHTYIYIYIYIYIYELRTSKQEKNILWSYVRKHYV